MLDFETPNNFEEEEESYVSDDDIFMNCTAKIVCRRHDYHTEVFADRKIFNQNTPMYRYIVLIETSRVII